MIKRAAHAVVFLALLCPIAAHSYLADHSTLGFSFKDCAEAKLCEAPLNAYLQKTFPAGYSEEAFLNKLKSENYSLDYRTEETDKGDIKKLGALLLKSEHENIYVKWTTSSKGKLVEISGNISQGRGKVNGHTLDPTVAYLPPILQNLMSSPEKFSRFSEEWVGATEKFRDRLAKKYPSGSEASVLRSTLENQGFLEYVPPVEKPEFEEWRFRTRIDELPYEEWVKNKSSHPGCREWWEVKWKNEDGKISSLTGNFILVCI